MPTLLRHLLRSWPRARDRAMRRYRLFVTVLALAALALLAGCGGSDPEAPNPPANQPTVLFLHGGAWVGGSPAELEPLAATYRKHGYNAISITYRDGDNNILHLIDNVEAEVAKHRSKGPVILYGVSAGGTLAAAVAAAGKVDGGVVIGAPTDLETWSSNPYQGSLAKKVLDGLGMTPDQQRDASPINRLGEKPAPQLLQYGDRDEFVPVAQGEIYLRAARTRQPKLEIELETMRGVDHTGALAYTPTYAESALQWIQQRWPSR